MSIGIPRRWMSCLVLAGACAAAAHADIPVLGWEGPAIDRQIERVRPLVQAYSFLPPFVVIDAGSALETTAPAMIDDGALMIDGEAVLFLEPTWVELENGTLADVVAGELVFVTSRASAADEHCEVTCRDGSGTSACCQHRRNGRPARCRCWADDKNFDDCDAGGRGASHCRVGLPKQEPTRVIGADP